MKLEFPYQITTFLDREPIGNESVYDGENGWYAQVALKRRFKLNGISEEEFITQLKAFFDELNQLTIVTGELVKPERMPVRVIEVVNQEEFIDLHQKLFEIFGDMFISRFPERDGENYYPHITAEYNDTFVIPVEEYVHKTFPMNNIWLLKDIDDENSVAYMKIK